MHRLHPENIGGSLMAYKRNILDIEFMGSLCITLVEYKGRFEGCMQVKQERAL